MNQDLIPIEEFRHTPVIPIPEKDLAEHKQSIENANRRGFIWEVKKSTLISIGCMFAGMILFYYVYKVSSENIAQLSYKSKQAKVARAQVESNSKKSMEDMHERDRKAEITELFS